MLARGVKRLLYSQADAWLCYNVGAKRKLKLCGFPEKKIYTIFNSLTIDIPQLCGVPLCDRMRAGIKIVFCGRLTYRKQLDVIVRAVAELNVGGVALKFIGDGPARESLQTLAEGLGVSVEFVGALYDEDALIGHYSDCVLTVSPGEVGLTALQSMMMGVPVVSHGTPERQMPEAELIIPGVSGNLFEEGGVSELATTILKTINQIGQGQITAQSCREACRYYCARYQLSVIQRAVFGEVPDYDAENFYGLGAKVY